MSVKCTCVATASRLDTASSKSTFSKLPLTAVTLAFSSVCPSCSISSLPTPSLFKFTVYSFPLTSTVAVGKSLPSKVNLEASGLCSVFIS